MNDTTKFELQVDNQFNSWDFFQEFKRLQHQGHFKNVKYVTKLDAKGGRKEITPNADEFIVGPDDFDKFGIK